MAFDPAPTDPIATPRRLYGRLGTEGKAVYTPTLTWATRIAGIVHGVMPAIGASVAYRRCKVGMWDEELLASLVIGRTGRMSLRYLPNRPGLWNCYRRVNIR